ncbi:hypothetical protein ACFY4C_07365 [Actinomadura viridis]|uniref:hypothetical protein n=1 Tax=Actinomadura viridis TaxID=58110 RepID=UPI00368C4228
MPTPLPSPAALAATAQSDPRAAKSGVTRLARPLPAADLPLFFEEACREFAAAGVRELAEWAFGEARKVEKKHPGLRDLDRLHAVFLEFAPLDAVPPGALRDHVKLMAEGLAADEAHARFLEILETAFAAGVVPYARIFPDLLTLAKAAGVKKRDAEDGLAARLLHTGVLPGASHAVWRGARRPLGRIAAGDPGVLDLLLRAEPDERAQDADLAAEIRQMWLEALAEADAGAHVPPEWFFTTGRRCEPEVLFRLVDQAGERLVPATGAAVDDPALPYPGGSVYDALPGPGSSMFTRYRRDVEPCSWKPEKTDFGALAARLPEERPEARHALTVQVDAFVHGLSSRAHTGGRAALRALWAEPALRELLRELVRGWKAQAGSGSLPELDHALGRLVPLAEAGYGDLDPGFAAGLDLADPVTALLGALRGGIPSELVVPYRSRHDSGDVRILQHLDLLTITWRNGSFQVIGPHGRPDPSKGPLLQPQDHTLSAQGRAGAWHAGGADLFSRHRDGAWQTFLVEQDPFVGPVLSVDPDTFRRHPEAPSSAEVTFPGAAGPARVAYERGAITVTAHDGTVTAVLPYSPTQKQDRLLLAPPGWWPHLVPADPEGSAVLRAFDRRQAERLVDAAISGPLEAAEAVPELEVPLRNEVVSMAVTTVECLYRSVRLRDVLGMPPQPSLPPALRTRPDLPVTKSLRTVAYGRRLGGLMAAAARRPLKESAHPIGVVGDIGKGTHHDFGKMGAHALTATRPWTEEHNREAWLESLRARAQTPTGDGSGRWRALTLTWTGDGLRPRELELWRTPNGSLVFGHHYEDRSEALEHAPEGTFGPLGVPDWEIKGHPVPQGWGGADRVAALCRLLAERGPVPQDPAWARELAERTGISLIDAATICFGEWSRQPPEKIPDEIRTLFTDPGAPGRCLPWTLSYPMMDAVRAPLMPDDPADLWERGLDIARAAARHAELTTEHTPS